MALTDKLTAIANAIREKTGNTELLTLDQMPTEIAGIETGGNSGGDVPAPNDGKTRLYIKIADVGRMDVELTFKQSAMQGINIDWGDGTSELSGYGNTAYHNYTDIGEYVISLEPIDGCVVDLGEECGSDGCVMGKSSYNNGVVSAKLKKVEIGNNVNIGTYAFQYCRSLESVAIPISVTSIGLYAFSNCGSLASIKLPDSVTTISSSAFYACYALSSVVIPDSVTSIGDKAFGSCSGVKFFDFSQHTAVPTLGTSVFNLCASDLEIRVPAALYDEWIAATNWSTYASKIVAV